MEKSEKWTKAFLIGLIAIFTLFVIWHFFDSQENTIIRVAGWALFVILIRELALSWSKQKKKRDKEKIISEKQNKDFNLTYKGRHISVKVKIDETQNKDFSNRFINDTLHVRIKSDYLKSISIFQSIKNFYQKQSQKYILGRLKEISNNTGLKFKKANITFMPDFWINSPEKDLINIDILVISLSEPLIDYILTFELLFIELGHTKLSFWKKLSRFIIDWKTLAKKLKSFNSNSFDINVIDV